MIIELYRWWHAVSCISLYRSNFIGKSLKGQDAVFLYCHYLRQLTKGQRCTINQTIKRMMKETITETSDTDTRERSYT